MYQYILEKREERNLSSATYLRRLDDAIREEKIQRRYRNSSGQEYAMHKMICNMADSKRENASLLYLRMKNGFDERVYVYSKKELDKTVIRDCGYSVLSKADVYSESPIKTGDFLKIYARLAPTRFSNGKSQSIKSYDERMQWVKRKIEAIGGAPIKIKECTPTHITLNKAGKFWINAYDYKMIVHIKDCEAFKNAIEKGVGRGRAFGCGMILYSVIL